MITYVLPNMYTVCVLKEINRQCIYFYLLLQLQDICAFKTQAYKNELICATMVTELLHHYLTSKIEATIAYSGNLLWEEIFVNQAILLSEETFVIFDFNLPGDFCEF